MRRSQPMMRSRLRRPMSKSMTATFLPRRASPQPRLAAVVVLPTPPFPDVTTMISGSFCAPAVDAAGGGVSWRIADISDDLLALRRADASEVKILAFESRLHRLACELGGNRLEHTEHARDGHELGIELLAKNARRLLAARAGKGATAQCAVDVDAAVGHDFRAGADDVQDDEIAIARIDTLPGTHRLVMNQRDHRLRRLGRGGGWQRRRSGSRRADIPEQSAKRGFRRRAPLSDQGQI